MLRFADEEQRARDLVWTLIDLDKECVQQQQGGNLQIAAQDNFFAQLKQSHRKRIKQNLSTAVVTCITRAYHTGMVKAPVSDRVKMMKL